MLTGLAGEEIGHLLHDQLHLQGNSEAKLVRQMHNACKSAGACMAVQ
jgi:hypothetical protein